MGILSKKVLLDILHPPSLASYVVFVAFIAFVGQMASSWGFEAFTAFACSVGSTIAALRNVSWVCCLEKGLIKNVQLHKGITRKINRDMCLWVGYKEYKGKKEGK